MRFGFNLKHEEFLKDIESNEVYQYNLIKNKALISGDGNVVRYFYRTIAPGVITGRLSALIQQDIRQSFLSQPSIDNAFVFFGITKMINRGVVRLVTSGGVKIKGEYQSRIEKLLKKNKFEKIWHEAVKQESGIGDILIRVVADPEVANHPIIELIEAERFELLIKRGFIIGYIIKARQQFDNEWYEMQEIYRKDNLTNEVIIEYTIQDSQNVHLDLKKIGDERINKIIKLFGLDKLKETVEGFPIQRTNLKRIPIVYKANTEVNKGLRGIADTDGFESIESALSEVLSNMVDEIRKAGLKILIDQKLQPITETGEPIPFDHFNKTIILTKSEGQDANKLIQSVQGDNNSNKYVEASKYLISIACNKAGLHPLTVGVTGVESIVASAESQQEREGKTSLRKREEKLIEWDKSIKELGVILLEMEDYISTVNDIGDYDENKIGVEFGKFTNPNPESIVAITQSRINAGIDSIKDAIKRDKPELDDAELDKAYAIVKSEKQLPLTPYEMSLLGIEPPVQPIINNDVNEDGV